MPNGQKEQFPVPKHIAIIMDGNGRWAQKRGLPRNAGHRQGAKVLENICDYCQKIGVRYVTAYAFSTENWKRPQAEVDTIMDLLRNYLKEASKQTRRNVRLLFLGDRTPLAGDIRQLMDQAERESSLTGAVGGPRPLGPGSYRRVAFCPVSVYQRNAISRSAHSPQRGAAHLKLFALAVSLYRICLYGCALAGFYPFTPGPGDCPVRKTK